MRGFLKTTTAVSALCAAMAVSFGAAAEEGSSVIKDRRIGFALNYKAMATYQTPDSKAECPQGFNEGPREQFVKMFPVKEGEKRTVADTQLKYESEWWNPTPDASWESQPFREAQGNIAIGLNLDGKVGPKDFTSPEGEKGIDNQLYRVIGCVVGWRGPDGQSRHFVKSYQQNFHYNRTMFEVTEVDSLVNDPDVTVTLYRGRDPLFRNSSGEFVGGGSQRIDYRWSKDFVHTMKGKIVDGVLITEPKDVQMPESTARGVPKMEIHNWQLKVKLTENGAEGLMGGYINVERFYNALGQNWGTHHRAYGSESLPSEYKALRRNADALPDANGVNQAISAAWEVKFSQVYIIHKPQQVATNGNGPATEAVPAR